MEKKLLNTKEFEMEMVTLTENEKQYVKELEDNLASGAGGNAAACICWS